MTMKVSTGLRNAMLGTASLKNTLTTMVMRIYSGAPPADADAAVTGTLLVTISKDGAGTAMGLGTAAAGIISKAAAETWQGTVASSGTAGYFRLVNTADAGGASTTEPRIQGTVAAAGADLNLTNPVLTAAAVQPINSLNIALPTA